MDSLTKLLKEAKAGKEDDASVDQVAELLDKLNLSDAYTKQLLGEILQGGKYGSGPVARMKAWLGEMPTLLMLLSFIILIFVFFGYKLYKSLVERERKRQEKRLQKQQKKKK